MGAPSPRPLIAVVALRTGPTPYEVDVYSRQPDGAPAVRGFRWLQAAFKDYPEAVEYAAAFNKREPALD